MIDFLMTGIIKCSKIRLFSNDWDSNYLSAFSDFIKSTPKPRMR